MNRREFLEVLGAASLAAAARPGLARAEDLYDVPRFGNVHLLHFTDCHAQLLPLHYREPAINLGLGAARGRPPHLVGEALRRRYGWARDSRHTHAFTHLDFAEAARRHGRVGGFAHLATLIRGLRASRPGALLLDGGDSWQGSATALWTGARDMVQACLQLGVDVMTGHWEFTLGADRVREIVDTDLAGRTAFLAHNVLTRDFEDPVFSGHLLRELNGVPVGIIGQAFPHTAIANPAHLVPDWSFGLREAALQTLVDSVRQQGAQVIVLLSHNGMDVDLKLAARVSGIDVVLGGHTHDGVPEAVRVKNRGGSTLVTNAGSNGKFLAVVDLDVRGGRLRGVRHRLLPVFADLLPADPDMQALIERLRAPHAARLAEPLAVSEGLLYRRGNFTGTFDQLLLEALMQVKDAPIAFSPGFRWGTAVLPGDAITREHVYGQTAITYPHTTVTEMTGTQIKAVLEDVCDNLFHPDPYRQQGGDMVRVGGMTYACTPGATFGRRISDLRLNGTPLDPAGRYRVAGWAPVAAGVSGEPIWDVVETWLRARASVPPLRPNMPRLIGIAGNPGMA